MLEDVEATAVGHIDVEDNNIKLLRNTFQHLPT